MEKLDINLHKFQTKIHVDEIKDYKFGRLTMIEEVEPTYKKKLKFLTWFKTKIRMVKCKCDCGNTCIVRLHGVINGQIKSCGCLQEEHRQDLHNRITPEGKKRMAEALEKSRNTPEFKARVREMGLHNRKYEEVCSYCGKPEHYALGYCRACYARFNRSGVVDGKEQRMARRLAEMEAKNEARHNKYQPTTERGKEFLIKFQSGMSLADIAREQGVSRQRIHQIMQK